MTIQSHFRPDLEDDQPDMEGEQPEDLNQRE